jgi:polyisoprenyl-phosphate glycosyltransferase
VRRGKIESKAELRTSMMTQALPSDPSHTTSATVSLVVPCHNEQDAIDTFFGRVASVLDTLKDVRFEIIAVDDGSTDDTLDKLLGYCRSDARIRVIELARNFGKEAALTAGIDAAGGDAVIPIDADLQDPPELIPQLIEQWRAGYDVVLAKRADRRSDTRFKRATARWFYRLHNRIAEFPLPENIGDYRLMSRAVVDAVKLLPERRRFMKGVFAWVGFRTAVVEYARENRSEGDSKFNAWRLWNFALEGITSFSTMPLRIWTYFGLIVSVLAFAYMAYIIGRTIVLGVDVPGYASLLATVLFLGGVQLIGIGVIGEYIGRIYHETKQRPIYIVRREYRQE